MQFLTNVPECLMADVEKSVMKMLQDGKILQGLISYDVSPFFNKNQLTNEQRKEIKQKVKKYIIKKFLTYKSILFNGSPHHTKSYLELMNKLGFDETLSGGIKYNISYKEALKIVDSLSISSSILNLFLDKYKKEISSNYKLNYMNFKNIKRIGYGVATY